MSIKSISPGTPLDLTAIRDKAKATSVKSTVTEVGARLRDLDQVSGVDQAANKDSVDVSDAKLPSKPGVSGLIASVVPEKVTGMAEFTPEGELQSLYTSSQDYKGTKELQYQKNEDGSQIYAVTTPTGQTTVRETPDGRLFMLESPLPSGDDFNTMAGAEFKAPELAPGEVAPRTLQEVLSEENTKELKANYGEGVQHRTGLLKGLLSEETRGSALKGLADEALGGWNPFKRKG